MKANAVTLLALFEKKMRLEVPLFQRQYVWSREEQWEPLWEDIERKFTEYLNGRKDAPVHFLGAMVLDQKQTPSTHVEKRQVIDGQQRLTTLQIFLAALRDFCREQKCEDLASELESFTLNKGILANPEVDKFKVWPTQLDRAQFCDVVGSLSRAAVETKHPLTRRKYARKDDPRPRMVEAYLFFSDSIRDFFLGTDQEKPLAADQPLAVRIDDAFQALKNALQVVSIDLEKEDDAQVIFETLNARGEPLLPADLLRNHIFLRAARQGEPQEDLYEKYWRGFDDDFWREEVRQGRLVRPRSDLFIQHFLSSRQFVDIPIKHLFVEYKFWIERARPFENVTKELATLARQRDHFRRIVAPEPGDVVFELATFLERFDIRTAYPLMLFLLDSNLSEGEWKTISVVLESYLLRRAVLGWTTKAYNRVFLSLTKSLKEVGPSGKNLEAALVALSGESSGWPTDTEFSETWLTVNAYEQLNNARLGHILRRISNEHLTKLSECITIDSPLTIEHLMPQKWVEHWPLPGGNKGLSPKELFDADSDDEGGVASRRRNAILQTLGNLTIVTQGLNSSVSNSAWAVKKPELLKVSLLPINQQLHQYGTWDEDAIERRGKALFEEALKIWPRPAPQSA
ncbi:DUF262 domain-containing protein [Corallococcus sp. AB011P]|uniref:DUF262 domain-containing protein n=1 Tax=Corallococcus sp. AB011P TaxID=2316735 RepID=UPI000EA0372C|nr:DUF262 domain-containing protein [Corallococcus sp. AB011P]RKG49835.1 DUF262 domain-containing protein [Corallococcus sp. AB011P]